jgi:hypothetical protein
LVVASVKNEDSKGQTNDSPAKQRPVPNDDPAIVISSQLYVPMISTLLPATSTAKSTQVSATTTARMTSSVLNLTNLLLLPVRDGSAITMATHANFTLQLIVASFQMVLSAHNIFGDITLFSNSEGERAS